MNTHLKFWLSSFIMLMAALFSSAEADKRHFNQIVVFGDSLSDSGYLHALTGIPMSPPYYGGRFSNGPVWIEYVTQAFGMNPSNQGDLRNLSVGGASTIRHVNFSQLPTTIGDQMAGYLFEIMLSNPCIWPFCTNKHDHYADKVRDKLFVVLSGPNDYWMADIDSEDLVDRVIGAIDTDVRRLIDFGAQNFFMMSIPDMSLSPFARESGLTKQLHAVTEMHNKKLINLVDRLRRDYPHIELAFYDITQLVNAARANAAAVGLTDVENACYTGTYYHRMQPDNTSRTLPVGGNDQVEIMNWMETQPALQVALDNSQSPRGIDVWGGDGSVSKCEGYLFFDDIHPTTFVHHILAQQAYRVMSQYFKR